MVINSYAFAIKETKHAALLLSIGKRSTSVDVSQQMGTEVPVLDGSTMSRLNADGVFRATRHVNEYGRLLLGRHKFVFTLGQRAQRFSLP